MNRISRRNLIASTILGLLGTATAWRAPAELSGQEREWAWYLDLFLQNTPQTHRLAAKYLEQRPEENTDLVVLGWLRKSIGPFSGSYMSWLRRVDSSIKTDFEMGRQISLDGWIMSETEARLCVLRCRQHFS